VLTLKRAKAFQGKFILPPSPDLFLLASIAALAVKRPLTISGVQNTPGLEKSCNLLSAIADTAWQDNACVITPRPESATEAMIFDSDHIPYRDLVAFLAFSMKRPVLFKNVSDKRLAFWQDQAQRIGFSLKEAAEGECRGLKLLGETSAGAAIPVIEEQDIQAALGLFWGIRAKRSFQIDFPLHSPLRHLAPFFGIEINVKRDIGEAEKDPIARRMKIMARQRLSSQEQLFTVTVDCTGQLPDAVDATLPGDEVLFSHVLLAKALLHRGSLVIDNAPLEQWATPMLALMRKMGCKPSLQENRETLFGSCGMVSLTKFELTGQKTDCSSQHQGVFHLPAMAVLCGFAEGESLFRKFDDLRRSDPDTIRQVEACLRIMQVKFGDLPDGFIIKGAGEYDGFDLIEPLPAQVSGAFAMAGLSCAGSTTVHDEAILERWPDYDGMIEKYFEFRQ
jgi:hypothetical protein